MNILNYHIIQSKKDKKIILFLEADKSWLEKDLDINLTESKELSIKIELEEFKSKSLEVFLYDHILNKETLFVFLDKDANLLSEFNMPPMSPDFNKKKKTI